MREKIKKNQMLVCIIVTIVLICGSYTIGYNNGKGKSSAPNQYAGGLAGGMRNGGGNRNAGFINGDVIAKDDTSITVKGRDGSSKIVLYTPTTPVMKNATGSLSDITIGSQLMIQGKTNSDGSITASSIQIRPEVQKINQPATTAAN